MTSQSFMPRNLDELERYRARLREARKAGRWYQLAGALLMGLAAGALITSAIKDGSVLLVVGVILIGGGGICTVLSIWRQQAYLKSHPASD